MLRHREGLFPRRCCRPRTHRQHPHRPGVADVLGPPIGCRGEHGHPLPPQHGLAGKLTPPLLPRGISIEGEDEITHPSDPIPPPALHTEDRHHPGFSCGRRVSETAWFGWWRLVLVLQIMQHHSVELPRRRYLFWSRSTREVGLTYPCNVHEQFLTFFVLRTPEECPDKRFDRVTRVGILQRTDGPACNELIVKLLFPPLGLTKERYEFVRNLLETSSAELAQDFLQSFVFIHRLLTSSVWVCPGARGKHSIPCAGRAPLQPPRATSALLVASRIHMMSKNGG